MRWAVNDQLLVTAGYSNIEVINLSTEENGGRFSFIGNEDLPGIPGELLYGGTLGGSVQLGNRDARRAGIPENIYTATATYEVILAPRIQRLAGARRRGGLRFLAERRASQLHAAESGRYL